MFFRESAPRTSDGVEGFLFAFSSQGSSSRRGAIRLFRAFSGLMPLSRSGIVPRGKVAWFPIFPSRISTSSRLPPPMSPIMPSASGDGAEGSKRRKPRLLHAREYPKRNPASPLDSIFEIGAVCGVLTAAVATAFMPEALIERAISTKRLTVRRARSCSAATSCLLCPYRARGHKRLSHQASEAERVSVPCRQRDVWSSTLHRLPPRFRFYQAAR